MEEYIQIKKTDLEFLVNCTYELDLLDNYGVDNWPSYCDAISGYDNDGVSLDSFRNWSLQNRLVYLGIKHK